MFKVEKEANGYLPSKYLVGNKILSRSLMWFGGAITLVLLFAYAVLTIPALSINLLYAYTVMNLHLGSIGSLFLLLGAIIIHFVFYWLIISRTQKLPFFVLVMMFGFIVFMDAWVVVFSFFYANLVAGSEGILLVVSIPMIATIILGILGYYKMINFRKLLPVMLFLMIALFISSIIGFFVVSNFLTVLITSLGTLFYLFYLGWIFYEIQNEQKYLSEIPVDYWNRNDLDQDDLKVVNQAINRASLAYGLLIFMAFVRLVYYMARILGHIK